MFEESEEFKIDEKLRVESEGTFVVRGGREDDVAPVGEEAEEEERRGRDRVVAFAVPVLVLLVERTPDADAACCCDAALGCWELEPSMLSTEEKLERATELSLFE